VCQRAGCQRSASVTLSFRYDARQASLVDLSAQKHPADYDLCAAHADLLIVPRGWERLDRRTPPRDPDPAVEAFVRGVEEVMPRPAPFNRYAALTAELPRLAEACGLTVSGDDGAGEPTPRLVEPPSRLVEPASGLYEPVTGTMFTEDDVIEGQLQMPIEPESEGVVVALMRTRQA
jgi:hypothetical protein